MRNGIHISAMKVRLGMLFVAALTAVGLYKELPEIKRYLSAERM